MHETYCLQTCAANKATFPAWEALATGLNGGAHVAVVARSVSKHGPGSLPPWRG